MTDAEQDLVLSRACAKLAAQVIATAPATAQVQAGMMIATAMVIAHIKPEHRLRIFDEYVAGAKAEIVKSLKEKSHAKKAAAR